LQLLDQFKNLRLNGHVQRSGRLVANEQAGAAYQCHGNHRTLAHAAAKLVRVGVDLPLWVGDAYPTQHLNCHLPRGCPAHAFFMNQYRLHDLVANGMQRAERRHRLLEDHADLLTADFTHFLSGGRKIEHVDDFLRHAFFIHTQQDLSPHLAPGWRRNNAHQRLCRHRFPAAAFANHSQRAAFIDLEADIIDGFDCTFMQEKISL